MSGKLKVGLIGIGSMGSVHLEVYERLRREGYPIELTALCDIDEAKFRKSVAEGETDHSLSKIDFAPYRLYADAGRMIEEEPLDMVDIALPTDLHAETAIAALRKGLHVLCEKPMALRASDALRMAEEAQASGRRLMIAQCLRFWPAYQYLKACADEERYGKPLAASFFRGGMTPLWSHRNWMLQRERSGGSLLDQHIHDVDMIHWLFGLPEAVSCMGRNVVPGSGFDIVSTHYRYPDGKVVNAQDDWTLQGGFGFEMSFRVNFERGNLVFEKGRLTDNPQDGEGFVPQLSEERGYYGEIRYFADCIREGRETSAALPEETAAAIRMAEAELASAERGGEWTKVAGL